MIIIDGHDSVDYSMLDDMTLAVLAEDGDEEAIKELVRRYPNIDVQEK